jgi:hypothetical protein
MKKLFTLITILCAVATPVFAQKALLGIKAGPSFNSIRFNAPNADPGLHGMVGIQFAFDGKKVQGGIGLNFGRQGYTERAGITYHVNDNFFNYYAFVSKKFNLVKSYIYTGVNIGYTSIPTWGRSYALDDKEGGLQLGVQAGYSVGISKKVNFFTEINIEYYAIDYLGGVNERSGLIRIPLMVGLNFRI